ncbi:hypothetical protein B0181_05575 [Moraxella caviae]|uniref:Ribonuclease H n=1 Tax=Moraxella caviae TaxID=34060 RepID=A0A1T0A2T7_9GAMM|nr:DNA polymerase III subunit epsilon [Moraxella caviae]OOR90112.1 hypothetical protein B0181_05575 [Moraxella caviae]STZ14737.1 DNA polymerase III subunit epsilon [Moraxella caviae]VEW14013.1 DNA polymerase III subunit epsilon [Moraxella caviae]
MTQFIIAYTDGACKGNGKNAAAAGGFGAHICYPNGDIDNIWGGEADTTNNRMELLAAITALENTPKTTPLQLWTDSAYVKNGITEWIFAWKKNNWRKKDNKPVLNAELWQRLDALSLGRQIDWQWVKGHAGHAGNEMADELANRGALGAGREFIAHLANQAGDDHAKKQPADAVSNVAMANRAAANQATTETPTTHSVPQILANQTSDFHDDYQNGFHANFDDNHDNTSNHTNDNTNDHLNNTPINQKTNQQSKQAMTTFAISPDNNQNPNYDGKTDRANPDFWAILPAPNHRYSSSRQLIMDTETTGFEDQNGDRIVEVGVIEMIGRRFTGNKLHVYINPEKTMDDEVIKVHGISNEFLTDKPKFADVAQAVYDFMVDSEIIAHNAAFDMRFLKMEFDKVGLTDFSDRVQVTDSLAIAKQLYPGQKNSLDALVRRLDVGKQDRTFHGALLDSEILAEVYLAMTGGQIALAIDEDESANTEGGTRKAHFTPLHEYAHLLTASVADADADAAWRAQVLK